METKDQTHNRQVIVLLYFLVGAIAIILRFLHLGALPLGDVEAANALQALKIAQGEAVIIGSQPIYVSLTSMLFFVFGSSEFWARFWPALFGFGLVFIPLLFRNWLGEKGAIILAFFFAIEPGFTALSRTATGTMIGLVSLCAAVGFLLNRRSILAGIFTGIALLGGTEDWSGLIGILLSYMSYLINSKRITELTIDIPNSEMSPINWKAFTFTVGGTIIILGTVFLLKPATISGLGTSLAAYFGSWTASGASIKVMLISLLGEQFLAIPLALWGSFIGWKKQNGLNFLLGVWALISFLLTLANPSSQVVDWVWMLLPLWVLAALGLADLLSHFSKDDGLLKLFQVIATFSLLIFTYLNLLSIIIGTSNSSTQFSPILSIILPVALLIVVTLLIGWGWSAEASRQGFLLAIAILLVIATFGSAWKSAGLGSRPEMELWRADTLPVGRDLLMKSVNDLSLWNTGQKNGLDIVLLKEDQPSLKWALRSFANLKTADIFGSTETPSLVISSLENTMTLSQIYTGQVVAWSTTVNFENYNATDWAKWFAFRTNNTTNQSFLLWARTDLFKGS
jgi:hypothetical protein